MTGPSEPKASLEVPSSVRPQRSGTSLNNQAPHLPPASITESNEDEKTEFPPLDPSAFSQGRGSAEFSPAARADANRIVDDLELLRAERLISNQEHEENVSKFRSRRHMTEVEDTFNPPILEETKAIKKRDENAALYKFWAFLRKFPRFVRYLFYLFPGATLLLIPILLGHFAIDQNKHPIGGTGGTQLMWFGIWLEIVWGSLWVSRMLTSLMPNLFLVIARATGSINAKKWKDIGKEMELHTAVFLWMLAVLISFKPCCDGHRVPVPDGQEQSVDVRWIDIVFKVIIAFFVLAALNFVEKIGIQWIATEFHERTYATRIENNKGDIRQLVCLFEYAKDQLHETDSFWHGSRDNTTVSSTPMRAIHENAQKVLGKVGQVAGRVGNDLLGRKVDSNHPRKVVGELLRTTSSCHTLARLIYRSLVRPDQEMVYMEDVRKAFGTDEEAEAAFNVFDKDLNNDISLDEFEAVTSEIGMEKKAIAASLKDLDSVIKKLDKVFLFIICIITIIVFISIISGSAAAGLASAGSSVLGLAWVLQATAQEFLQSIIFVFVKHPFDVGDRVTIYGSTGANMTGDDYYVTEISLLYTEFKKLQGHVVQAPNSLLNTLFILNQRRSNGLADPITLQMRFGTPAWQIDELKARMLKFVVENKREFQPTILAELSAIEDMRSATWTIVFIHKSNYQNEVARLQRHNKFMVELMHQIDDIGIQSPFRIDPGGSKDHPLHWTGVQPPPSYSTTEQSGPAPAAAAAPGPSASAGSLARRPSASGANSSNAVVSQIGPGDIGFSNMQDVFENRKEHFLANRLASIREKDRAEKAAQEVSSDSEPRLARANTSSVAAASLSSQTRNRFFSRARSSSRSQQVGSPARPAQGSDIV